MAKKGKTTRSTVRSKRKPNNPREALAWLRTIAEHIGETFKAYMAHKLPDKLPMMTRRHTPRRVCSVPVACRSAAPLRGLSDAVKACLLGGKQEKPRAGF